MLFTSRPKNFNPQFVVVSCFIQYNDEFILLHRQGYKPEGNTWGMPAGKIKLGEDIHLGVIREVEEETGLIISRRKLNYFKEFFVQYPKYDFVYHIFNVTYDKKPEISINKDEHQEYKWVKPEEALKMNCIQDLDECIKRYFSVSTNIIVY